MLDFQNNIGDRVFLSGSLLVTVTKFAPPLTAAIATVWFVELAQTNVNSENIPWVISGGGAVMAIVWIIYKFVMASWDRVSLNYDKLEEVDACVITRLREDIQILRESIDLLTQSETNLRNELLNAHKAHASALQANAGLASDLSKERAKNQALELQVDDLNELERRRQGD